jgi:citrate lyase subunit beta / citryl-CoA lyase
MHRSFLFIPGNNPAMLQNADVFGADAVIFDLEDAVSFSEKDAARQLIKSFFDTLKQPGFSVYVRINAVTSSLGAEDLNAVLSEHVDGIVLPKATVVDIKTVTKLLETFEMARNKRKRTSIIPIIETAKAVLEIEAIAQMPRVSGLLLGAEDLTGDMEIERTETGEEIEYPRAKLAYACKAFGIEAIDTPFTDVYDEDGLEKDSLHALALGMNAKAVIHPNQIECINRIFSPSRKAIEQAMRIIAADLDAQTKHRGVFSLDGKMIDKPVVDRAKKLIQKAEQFGLIGDSYDK